MLIRCLVLSWLLLGACAQADEAEKRALAEELVELTDADAMMDGLYAQLNQLMNSSQNDEYLSDKQKIIKAKYTDQLTQLMQAELSWEKLEQPTLDLYVKHFTVAELEGMVNYYRTDVGQSMLKKMPVVMGESMQLVQPMMEELMPKMQVIIGEMTTEIMKQEE